VAFEIDLYGSVLNNGTLGGWIATRLPLDYYDDQIILNCMFTKTCTNIEPCIYAFIRA
jgi:hypothetical protein